MNFKNLGSAFLSLFAFSLAAGGRNPRVKKSSATKGLDDLFVPAALRGNMPAPSRKNIKKNRRQERKAAAKKRTIKAHKAGAKKNKRKEKAKREKVKREKRLKKY